MENINNLFNNSNLTPEKLERIRKLHLEIIKLEKERAEYKKKNEKILENKPTDDEKRIKMYKEQDIEREELGLSIIEYDNYLKKKDKEMLERLALERKENKDRIDNYTKQNKKEVEK